LRVPSCILTTVPLCGDATDSTDGLRQFATTGTSCLKQLWTNGWADRTLVPTCGFIGWRNFKVAKREATLSLRSPKKYLTITTPRRRQVLKASVSAEWGVTNLPSRRRFRFVETQNSISFYSKIKSRVHCD
jgi:hypothetical protein